jgi:hypothetical protein
MLFDCVGATGEAVAGLDWPHGMNAFISVVIVDFAATMAFKMVPNI